ncbi:hypothetical protein Vretimale_867 [Volvox reticuliferus]|uniref:Uncharacterized protein n=1 Tax=Volvox reticuliferus TaxID=1737510 RepID=A0A8J4BZP0_9CHLO|nr:hypothetical protein Vretifemale_2219 [Volvox reticuliferus]GIL94636.1 hypothetical protein Vretimale_867 [Volvox reticuliferus]
MNFFNKVKNLFFGGDESSDDDDVQTQRHHASEGASPSSAAPKRQRSSGTLPSKPSAKAAAGTTEGGPTKHEPVLRDVSSSESGGVQGLDWYAASQIQDQHGDFANEFFNADTGAKSCAGTSGVGGRQRRGATKVAKPNGGPVTANEAARQPNQLLKVKDVQQGAVILEKV